MCFTNNVPLTYFIATIKCITALLALHSKFIIIEEVIKKYFYCNSDAKYKEFKPAGITYSKNLTKLM